MKLESIPLDEIDFGIVNARKQGINVGIEELAASIKAIGILQPITVYKKSDDGKYVILAGQRRFWAHQFLNEKYPNKGFDKIQTVVIPEPETDEEKHAISLASNTESLEMKRMDIFEVVNELWDKYNDYKIISEKLGISKYMIKKYVRLGRLPQEIKDAINQGAIHSNSKTAENYAIKAVDVFGWEPGNDVDVNMVIDFAKRLAELSNNEEKVPKDAFWRGHLWVDGGIVGDGYKYGRSYYAVIVVGDDKGVFKNDKKMTKKQFEKLPEVFRNSLRLPPRWDDDKVDQS